MVALSLLAGACSDGSGPGQAGTGGDRRQATPGGVFRVPIGEPAAIDPYNTRESEGMNVHKALFVGLVTYDGNPELEMRPGVATEWGADEACTRWTFRLRESEFSNGEPVTAESFIRGWTRTVDARSASQVAYHFSGVEGYDALHGDPQTASTFSGLSAPDPHTLVVELSGPDCEFDKKTLVAPAAPVPSVAGPADNPEYNEAPIGNGPFMIEPGTRWERGQRISLVRNPRYHGTPANLEGVEFLILPARGRLEAEYRAFLAGDVDFARVPPGLFRQARDFHRPRGGFLANDQFGINYLLINHQSEVMATPEARKAVSMAIDRIAISEGVFQGALRPASALVPPAFGELHQPEVCGDACDHDPDRAAALAVEGGLAPGSRLRLLYNTDGGHEPVVQAWKEQLESTLGVVVELTGVPFAESLLIRDQGEFDIAPAAWGAEYPSVESFLFPLLSSGSDDNDGRYRNPEVDRLLGQLRTERGEGSRREAAQEAERIAIGQDLAVAPFLYRTQYRVFDAEMWTGVGLDFFENPTLGTIGLRA